jgi:hypothetical protein
MEKYKMLYGGVCAVALVKALQWPALVADSRGNKWQWTAGDSYMFGSPS